MTDREFKELQDKLETLIDSSSLKDVIQAIEEVCYAKGQHLKENWQDPIGKAVWLEAGSNLTTFMNDLTI
jgi:hypothetical protein